MLEDMRKSAREHERVLEGMQNGAREHEKGC